MRTYKLYINMLGWRTYLRNNKRKGKRDRDHFRKRNKRIADCIREAEKKVILLGALPLRGGGGGGGGGRAGPIRKNNLF